MSRTGSGSRPGAGEEGFAPELGVLLETARKLAETLDLPVVLQAAVDGITGLVGLDTAAVYLLDGDHLQLWATHPPLPAGFPDHLRQAPLTDHPHVADALATRSAVTVEDLQRDALTLAEQEVAAQRDLRTVLYVPLLVEGDAIGAFIVGSTGAPARISGNRIVLANALASLSALATRNAILFEKVQTRSAELQQALEEKTRLQQRQDVLQAQLSQAQKLESIGRLAGGVAHDFNNMLLVIQGYADLALDAVPARGEAHEHLLQVQDAARRSAEITRQLLAFARKQTIAPRVIDLNATVAGMLKMLRRLLGEDLDLLWVPAPSPVTLLLDPSQLDQILANLCVNAREAIAGGGKVTIETHTVEIDEDYCAAHPGFEAGTYGLLVVSDNGHGMDAPTQEKLFDPFFTTKEDGTGLGLATVYGIVRQNDGFIHVYSEPGVGTTFRIYLPISGAAATKPAASGTPETVVGDETVLVVEDNEAILRLTATMLAGLGYDVLTARLPDEAMAAARGHPRPVRLLVTDVVMPGSNGRELARRLQATLPDLKVLFMSGYTANVIAHRGVLDADVHFIQKPFTRKALADRVREVLDG